MTNSICRICEGTLRVRLPVHHDLTEVPADDEISAMLDETWQEFDCPACIPMVPCKRVRAAKIISEYDIDKARRFQEPIQRSLASRFGEYLLKKGLIRFSVEEDDRLSNGEIRIVAEMGVVTIETATLIGAPVDSAETDPPPLPTALETRLRKRETMPINLMNDPDIRRPEFSPFRKPKSRGEKVREQREGRETARDRFSGLELFEDADE